MPTVSVCIPTYNRKDMICFAVDSVLAQTYKDYEIIVVDDGSTDGTEDVLLRSGYDLRYHKVDHCGQQACRNKLIELAKGEYITFVDSDDLIFPYTLEILMNVINQHGLDVIPYGSNIGVDENGNDMPRPLPALPSGFITAELFEFIYVHTCGNIIAKRIYEEAGCFNAQMKRCAVYKLLLDLSLKYKFIGVDKPTFKKRRHAGNAAERNYAWRKMELDVLEDFYYNLGGKDVVPHDRAMARLSKEAYRAGACAVRQGLRPEALALLKQSLNQHPNLKSLAWLAAASFKLHPGLW